MPTRTPPETEEGWLVSHLMFRIAPERVPGEADSLGKLAARQESTLEEFAETGRFDLVRLVSSPADFMTVYFAEDLRELDRFQRGLLNAPLGRGLERVYTFLSVTELSMYEPVEERVEAILRRKDVEPGTEEYEQERAEQMQRMESYQESRLHPEIPDMPCVTFYPMEKRRNPQQNWYQLPAEERSGMMKSHGKIGRKYGGRIQQIITSCVGLDEWEWGVTLYGEDPAAFKQLIYEMRFDEVSASYSEFGPFYTGYKLKPGEFSDLF